MFDYNFGPDNTYLVACTYSPESMALVDMMRKNNVKIVLCFVNYHIDERTELAQKYLTEYCKKKDLNLELCDTNLVKNRLNPGDDYQKWARKVRYDFFKEIVAKYDAAALFIAHTQDDILESYFLLKEGEYSKINYKWNKISTYLGMIVVRPLLDFSKEDLIEYCNSNNVPYSDEYSYSASLTSLDYIRDKIYKLNEVERGNILDEINKTNFEKKDFIKTIKTNIKAEDSLNVREILALDKNEFAETIIDFVNRKSPTHCTLTTTMIDNVRTLCLSRNENDTLYLRKTYYLVKEYDLLFFNAEGTYIPYTYVLEKPCKFSCEAFDLDFTAGAEDRNIKEDDYPITVRSALPQDVYPFRGGYYAPVRRMLVEMGIPSSDKMLKIWPVFLNKK